MEKKARKNIKKDRIGKEEKKKSRKFPVKERVKHDWRDTKRNENVSQTVLETG